MNFQTVLERHANILARGWIVEDGAQGALYLSPFPSRDSFVWDDRLLPLGGASIAGLGAIASLGRVEVVGVWDGNSLQLTGCVPSYSLDGVVVAYRELSRLVEGAYRRHYENGVSPSPAFEDLVMELRDHPSVLAVTRVTTPSGVRVYAACSSEVDEVEELISQGPPGPIIALPSRWSRELLEDAREFVDSIPSNVVLKMGGGITGRGEPYVHGLLMRMPADFTERRSHFPDELLDVQPWILDAEEPG